MIPSEKLKDIELTVAYSNRLDTEDIKWLINRVHRLTEALDYIEGNCEYGMDGQCDPRCDACVARKALEAGYLAEGRKANE